MSVRDRDGRIVGAKNWARRDIYVNGLPREAIGVLREHALDGVGDKALERVFRMNITLCIHRAATPEEVAAVPHDWQAAPSGMAGGPVEIISEKGIESSMSASPCESPEHISCIPTRPDLWVPGDCGRCEPCRARARIEKGFE